MHINYQLLISRGSFLHETINISKLKYFIKSDQKNIVCIMLWATSHVRFLLITTNYSINNQVLINQLY